MDSLLSINVEKRVNNIKRICIVSVIEKEMEAIIDKYKLEPHKKEDFFIWSGESSIEDDVYKIDCYQMLEKGNIESTLMCTYVLEKEYDFYFLVGTAGSSDVDLYDVILATKAVYNGIGTHESGITIPDTDIRQVNSETKNLYLTFELWFKKHCCGDFALKVESIYSSNYVEKDPDNVEYLRARETVKSIKAVEMEAYGAFSVVDFIKSFKGFDRDIIILRGISDKADKGKAGIYEDGLSPDERKIKATQNALLVMEAYCCFYNTI